MPDTLLILTPGFPADETDTACLPPQQVFIRALKAAHPKLNIVILSFHYPFGTKEYVWEGVRVIPFDGKAKKKIYRLITWFKVWKKMRLLHRSHKIIGILSFWLGETAFIGDRFAKRRNIKQFSWLLGQDAKAGNKYARRSKSDGNNLIAISDFVKRIYGQSYNSAPAHVIPIGVYPPMADGDLSERSIDVLGAGSLIPLKRYHMLVEVVNDLKPTHPNIKAVLCGDGPEMKRLQTLIAESGLKANIELKAEVPHRDVIKLMQRSKVFLHPSEYEGFGVVCLEALGAGASVISFVKPMDAAITRWHIVNSRNEMANTAKALLADKAPDYRPVTPFLIENTAREIMQLFDYKD